jgi:PPOX class probable F420-dependent enzyme
MLPTNPRADARLQSELIIWLTTVRPNGQPQVSPVWFIVEDDEVLVYSKPGVAKLSNLEANPRVALNLDGNGMGGDIVTLEGRARIVADHPAAHEVSPFVAKYAERIERNGWTPESFAADYSVAIRITVTRRRVW